MRHPCNNLEQKGLALGSDEIFKYIPPDESREPKQQHPNDVIHFSILPALAVTSVPGLLDSASAPWLVSIFSAETGWLNGWVDLVFALLGF